MVLRAPWNQSSHPFISLSAAALSMSVLFAVHDLWFQWWRFPHIPTVLGYILPWLYFVCVWGGGQGSSSSEDVVDATHDLLSTVGVIVLWTASFVIYHFEPKLMCLLGYPLFRPAVMISIIPEKTRKSQWFSSVLQKVCTGCHGSPILAIPRPTTSFYVFVHLFGGKPITTSIYKK